MVEVTVPVGSDEKKFSITERRDTNLMLGGWKSVFTMLRSHYVRVDGEKEYEYWIKFPKPYRRSADYFFGPWYANMTLGYECTGFVDDSEIGLENQDAPDKLVFDSRRVAYRGLFNARVYDYSEGSGRSNNLVGNWVFVKPKNSEDAQNFDIYGHIALTVGGNWPVVNFSFSPKTLPELAALLSRIEGSTVELEKMVWSGKVAEVRDGEIISNTTPEQNTYYVAIENKRGDLLDVKFTTTFGVTVGSVAGEYADRMSKKTRNMRVIDDLLVVI